MAASRASEAEASTSTDHHIDAMRRPLPTRRMYVGQIISPESLTSVRLLKRGVLGVDLEGRIAFVHDLDQIKGELAGLEQDVARLPKNVLEMDAVKQLLSPSTREEVNEHDIKVALAVAKRHGWEWQTCASFALSFIPLRAFLMPGFIDTHTHAPQVPNLGCGQQYELLDWLHNVTFPRERKFADPLYAHKTYDAVVQRMLNSGTTCAAIYATLHEEATKILADVCNERGMRAFVGKCQMDRNSPDEYREKSVVASMDATRSFVKYCEDLKPYQLGQQRRGTRPYTITGHETPSQEKPASSLHGGGSTTDIEGSPNEIVQYEYSNHLVQPILTPRFAISCSDELLGAISELAQSDQSLRIQTHLSENNGEIAFTKELFPTCQTYTEVYDKFALLRKNTILAHAIHLEESEMDLIAHRRCGISHCPTSNMNLRSGTSRIGQMLNRGIKVGLGTDMSGGFGMSILSTIRDASVAAKVLQFSKSSESHTPNDRLQVGSAPMPLASPPSSITSSIDVLKEEHAAHQVDFCDGPLPISALFYMATLGGAEVCNVKDVTGSLDVGKDFDALIVHPAASPNVFSEEDDTLEQIFEKFLFCGDDRCITSVFVSGRIVGGASPDYLDEHRVMVTPCP